MLQLEDELCFGRYKNCTIQFIYKNNPQYLFWLNNYTQHKISPKIMAEVIKNMSKDMDEDTWDIVTAQFEIY
jgi:hypothetical protein